MAEQKPSNQPEAEESVGITRITGAGFKSIAQEQSIEVRPLTILAGVNSSGKSSIMQPLLLLKQTLDATYDPGALLLNGPNVRFTSIEQILSRVNNGQSAQSFSIGAENLIEAALQADQIVISMDETVRHYFRTTALTIGIIRQIVWVNPCKIEETPLEWLKAGTALEKERSLGQP